MPVSVCKDCGAMVSTSAEVCPKCGAIDPAVRHPVRLSITRNKSLIAVTAVYNVIIDDNVHAQLWNGEKTNITILSGTHSMKVAAPVVGGIKSDIVRMEFEPNQQYNVKITSQFLGINLEIIKV